MIDQLTFDDLRAYQSGQLSGPARYRVERLLLENPFYADALAGLEAMQQTAASTSVRPTSVQLAELRDALHERIHASATKKRLWPLWIATTTAAILFMLAVAIYLIFFAPKQPSKPIPKPAPTAMSSVFNKTIFGAITVQEGNACTIDSDKKMSLPFDRTLDILLN